MTRCHSGFDTMLAVRAWKNRAPQARTYYQGSKWRCFIVNYDVLMTWTRDFRLDAWVSKPEWKCKDQGLVLHLGFIQIVIRWPGLPWRAADSVQ